MTQSIRLIVLLFLLFLVRVSGIKAQDVPQHYTDFLELYSGILNSHVHQSKVDYQRLLNNKDWQRIVEYTTVQHEFDSQDPDIVKSFRINAYNIQVINQVLKHYPIQSVQEVPGFFDRKKIMIEGTMLTLNQYEKQYILAPFKDPRLHFVLVCAAVDCPELRAKAYTPIELDLQLENQTQLAINNPAFIRTTAGRTQISEIFKWYVQDFGNSATAIRNFINTYRESAISSSALDYYSYDWTLNDRQIQAANNAQRYVVSATIPRGGVELKWFNNLYSQFQQDSRSTYFTSSVHALFGWKSNLNIGFTGRFRMVKNQLGSSTPLDVFQHSPYVSKRKGLTALGPMIRYAPKQEWPNFSIQSSLTFPLAKALSGDTKRPFIDWSGIVWNTQFMNDYSIGTKWSMFTEVGLLMEDFGINRAQHNYRVSIPLTLIMSYYPIARWTVYGIVGTNIYAQIPVDYYFQVGAGIKYQITPRLELELLYTNFNNRELLKNRGTANTYNVGLRYAY